MDGRLLLRTGRCDCVGAAGEDSPSSLLGSSRGCELRRFGRRRMGDEGASADWSSGDGSSPWCVRFRQSLHLHRPLQGTPACERRVRKEPCVAEVREDARTWKHSQYFFTQFDFLQWQFFYRARQSRGAEGA